MNKDEALKFLELHQPMPADCDITQELIYPINLKTQV